MSIWEKFESHNNFNLDPNPRVFSNDHLGQTIKPTPRDSIFSTHDWFVPASVQEFDNTLEPDFSSFESIRTKEEWMPRVAFIGANQRELNFTQYMNKLNSAANRFELGKVAQLIYSAQKQENGNFFFPKNGSKQIWDAFKKRKAKMVELRNKQVTKELDGLLASDLTSYEIRRLKKDIYDIKDLDINIKKKYWAKCNNLLAKAA